MWFIFVYATEYMYHILRTKVIKLSSRVIKLGWNIYHWVRWFSHFNSQFTKDFPLKPSIDSWWFHHGFSQEKPPFFHGGSRQEADEIAQRTADHFQSPPQRIAFMAGVQSRIHQNPTSNVSISLVYTIWCQDMILYHLYIYIGLYMIICVCQCIYIYIYLYGIKWGAWNLGPPKHLT